MSEPRIVERYEDMSRHGRLALIFQQDGDIIVTIRPDPDARSWERGSVEFTMVGAGGGKSPETRKALIELAKAMERDNAESPIHR